MEILLSPPVLLTLAVIFVNGWTDAPNAIATAVGTGALRMGRAIALAAVCNLLGAVLSAALCPAVAATVLEIGDFSGRAQAQAALCAALLSIVLWAVAAWAFGIPTSESHALLAALSGAAVALQGTLSGVNAAAWGKVWWGLLLSVLLGLVLGGGLCVLMRLFLGRGCLERAAQRFRHWQVAGAAAMAFCHGAQDGQKFLGVLLLAEALRAGRPPQLESAPLWEALLCALVMGAGTAVGGRRIIRAVGQDMTPLMPYQGFAADTAAVACLPSPPALCWGMCCPNGCSIWRKKRSCSHFSRKWEHDAFCCRMERASLDLQPRVGKNPAGFVHFFAGRSALVLQGVVQAFRSPFVAAHLMKGQQFHPLNAGKSFQIIRQVSQFAVVERIVRHHHMAQPDGFLSIFAMLEQSFGMFAAAAGDHAAELWLQSFDVQQQHVRFVHGLPAGFQGNGAGGVDGGVKPFCVQGADQLKNKRALQQRLAAGQRHAAGAQERTVRQQAFHQLLHRDFPAAFERPGVRIVTVDAAQRAALKKDYIAYAWPVHGAEAFQ